MDFYFLFFGIILALQQLNLKIVSRNFRFLNYHWGKAIFCNFIACASLSNDQNQLIQYLNAAIFFILMVMFAILAKIDRQADIDRSAKDEHDYAVWKEKQDLKKAQKDPEYWVRYVQEKKRGAEEKYEGLRGAVSELKGHANNVQEMHDQYRAVQSNYMSVSGGANYDENSYGSLNKSSHSATRQRNVPSSAVHSRRQSNGQHNLFKLYNSQL